VDFADYQARAWAYDQHPEDPVRALTIALLGLGGEVGTLQTNQKKIVRDGPVHSDYHTSAVEDLGDILWYVADTATWLGVDLSAVAEANLSEIADRWPRHSIPRPPTVGPATAPPAVLAVDRGIGPAHFFDGAHEPAGERLPRTLTVQIAPSPYVAKADLLPRVLSVWNGKPCGNILGDNAYDDDGYRYHDAFHLAYLAVLGWSPVQRALLGRKRKSSPLVDDVEDGGRAIAIEEGIAAFVFEAASRVSCFEGVAHVDSEFLRVCQRMTAHLEVSVCNPREWEHAILQGFKVWRLLRKHGHGSINCDLNARTIVARPLSSGELAEHAVVYKTATATKQASQPQQD
jgi:NTP pyrophosphatase (non-canonical NTP hydrolase)